VFVISLIFIHTGWVLEIKRQTADAIPADAIPTVSGLARLQEI